MIRLRYLLILLLLSSLFYELSLLAQPLRIMPLGNSITYDDNIADKTHPRPVGDKISYRYKLYQLIKEAGYEFDFVGSENSGNNYFQDEEFDDNAGFSGINDGQMAYLISTGYNQRAAQYEAPGPYLLYYPADVILLHIGTNDITTSPDDVEDILDNIRMYDNEVIILVARIISRQPYPHAITTIFNNNVEAMVNARGDDRIIMVNMETGAGINYQTEMADYLHPTQAGYDKMAVKWFEALDNLNTPPNISPIPEQITIQGTPFNQILLDDYISDNEDSKNQIRWTCKVDPLSKIKASINSNRILSLFVSDENWYGSETIQIKATDSGNGSFRKSDSTVIKVTILKGNEPPVITTEPVTEIDEDNIYFYTIQAEDDEPLIYLVSQKPAWLTFSSSTHTLTGRPTNDDVGLHPVTIIVTDGEEYIQQSFVIRVNNVNDLPVITSSPNLSAKVGESYLYEITATDLDLDDTIHYSCVFRPLWLSFTYSNGKGLLFGVPDESNIGGNSVVLSVSDGKANILQGFTIHVSPLTSLITNGDNEEFNLYPNPVTDKIYIQLSNRDNLTFELYDLSGRQIRLHQFEAVDYTTIDISDLPSDIYIYKAIYNRKSFAGRILKTK